MKKYEDFVAMLVCCLPSLHSYGYMLTGDVSETDDLVQESVYRALRYYDAYEERGMMLYWLKHIMRSVFLNDVKRMSTVYVVHEYDGENVLPSLPDDGGSNSDDDVILDDVLRIIEGFSREFRDPLLMCMEGYRYDEIADRMGIPIGTVKSRIHFARGRLKVLLKK